MGFIVEEAVVVHVGMQVFHLHSVDLEFVFKWIVRLVTKSVEVNDLISDQVVSHSPADGHMHHCVCQIALYVLSELLYQVRDSMVDKLRAFL
jgi:hypothetical protein